ncbi:hypothetical protein GGI15_003497 [Coemansia interrupta]|uniref:Uncharacterized protein n=1 Tax=Coemansia interrupta TaxID=1126814 RepID=A0A9W8LIN9_9FUNG|nr:hypothetical protein GGI15_003497 [Coemansia interrupta]
MANTIDLEVERELIESGTPAATAASSVQPPAPADASDSQIERMLSDAITHIDGLMLVSVTDADREVLFREALSMFHEPLFEETLVNNCYDAFDDTKKLHIGSSKVMTLIYGAMQVVQFRVGPFYGTVVCDAVSNMGLVHNLVGRVRSCLEIISEMSKTSK